MIATDPETITKIQGVRFSLEPYSFHLSYSVKNSLPLDRFVRPQLECLINSSAIFQIMFFFVLSCVFDSQARISLCGEIRAVHG